MWCVKSPNTSITTIESKFSITTFEQRKKKKKICCVNKTKHFNLGIS